MPSLNTPFQGFVPQPSFGVPQPVYHEFMRNIHAQHYTPQPSHHHQQPRQFFNPPTYYQQIPQQNTLNLVPNVQQQEQPQSPQKVCSFYLTI